MSDLISVASNNRKEVSMTLKEITDLLEVRHNNAMRTVKKMAEDESFGKVLKMSSFYFPGDNGRKKPIETYQLDKRQSIAVASRLNTALLMRVIDRWQELESTNVALPQTHAEALRALANEVEEKEQALLERDEAIRTKGQISSSREASVMGQLSAASKKISKLKDDLGEGETYRAVKAVEWISELFDTSIPGAWSQLGKYFKKLSDELGIDCRETEHSAYKKVKIYHIDVITEAKSRLSTDSEALSKYRQAVSA